MDGWMDGIGQNWTDWIDGTEWRCVNGIGEKWTNGSMNGWLDGIGQNWIDGQN